MTQLQIVLSGLMIVHLGWMSNSAAEIDGSSFIEENHVVEELMKLLNRDGSMITE